MYNADTYWLYYRRRSTRTQFWVELVDLSRRKRKSVPLIGILMRYGLR
jgi:hypothetical protein